MEDNIILRTVVKMLIPVIFMFGLYVQFHGEFSPGGGFQAGVICAAALITHSLIHGLEKLNKIVSVTRAKFLACLGVLIYGGTGVVAMLKGGRFLDYSFLSNNPVSGQVMGIIFVELGVGLAVFSVMMLLFFMFATRNA
jgi:multicomponent Na+:H+ antiporter subunit B